MSHVNMRVTRASVVKYATAGPRLGPAPTQVCEAQTITQRLACCRLVSSGMGEGGECLWLIDGTDPEVQLLCTSE